jgi:hypothetical protein
MRGAVNLRPFNKVPAMLLICLISFEGAFELCSDFSSEAINSMPDIAFLICGWSTSSSYVL